MKKKILLLISAMLFTTSFAQNSETLADTAKESLDVDKKEEVAEIIEVSEIAAVNKDGEVIGAEEVVEVIEISDEPSDGKETDVIKDIKDIKTNSNSAEQRVFLSKKKSIELINSVSKKHLEGKSEADFKLKPHHEKLQFECKMCHEGDNWKDYKPLVTEDCLACHGSAEKIARRTKFMDVNYTNPHNSIHDKLDLDCQTCHNEHKPSEALCKSCHDNTKEWFKDTP